jgi:hypothetical protein
MERLAATSCATIRAASWVAIVRPVLRVAMTK